MTSNPSEMEHHLSHSKTFRYETNDIKNPKKVLYVLHGYGQLVKFFIKKFQPVSEEWLIVAPEGMHRFYLNGTSGHVGASWMTKEDREIDIIDTISYLNAVQLKIESEYGILDSFVLGFSQGGATAARWVDQNPTIFKGVCLWACVFPPDIHSSQLQYRDLIRLFVIGKQDEYYQGKEQINVLDFYEKSGFEIIIYNGNHDLHSETLLSVLLKMN